MGRTKKVHKRIVRLVFLRPVTHTSLTYEMSSRRRAHDQDLPQWALAICPQVQSTR